MENKFAVVTGASTGIGRAIALEFASRGAYVALVGRNKQKLSETRNLINQTGGQNEIFLADLSNLESLNQCINLIKKQTQRVDVLVNVAGLWHGENEVYAGKDFEKYEQKVIWDTYVVGLMAPTLLAHALVPLMENGGTILNISGTFENGAKGWVPYYVSKRAIEDLTIGLAEEFKDKNIQVNAISPSDTATEAYAKYFPQYLNEAIDPGEIAKQAVVLCLESSMVRGKVFVMKKDQDPYEGYHR